MLAHTLGNPFDVKAVKEFCDKHSISLEVFEKIRQRFAHVEPVGIGAIDLAESFLFQLDSSDISDRAYPFAIEVIKDLQNIQFSGLQIAFNKYDGFLIALAITGEPNEKDLSSFFELVSDTFTERYGEIIKDWSGDTSQFDSFGEFIENIVKKKAIPVHLIKSKLVKSNLNDTLAVNYLLETSGYFYEVDVDITLLIKNNSTLNPLTRRTNKQPILELIFNQPLNLFLLLRTK